MASTMDARDILGIESKPKGPAPKKKKRIEPQPRMTGISREVQALMGDSVPPIAIVEQKAYKAKPTFAQRAFKPRHWDERQFSHGGRSDGLVLRHWKRSIPGTSRPVAADTPTDVEMTDGGEEKPTRAQITDIRFEDEFPSEKWNIKVPVPTYTDEQYDESFKSENWSREETDYLMQLCQDYDLRWVIIADRYTKDHLPAEKQYRDKTEMEDMKSRYYTIAAKMMEIHTPAQSMTSTEFQLWEKMKSFDAKTEKARKEMAAKLFERTKDEAEEEKILLEELHRITKNEEDFIKLRRDLYSRLETAPAMRRTERGDEQSTAVYQTSAGLSMLLQSLLAKERKLKRPQMPNGEHATPVDPRKGHATQYSRRETIESQADDGPQKKGSTAQPQVRTLTPAEEAKYGVSHPGERLTSGVQFRHEKINRLTMAKSQVQTGKIQAALTELGIPPRLLMPTDRVCKEFERLVNSIHLLLEARKGSEKIKGEIAVLEETRRIRLGLPQEGDGNAPAGDAMKVDTSQAELERQETIENSALGQEETAVDDEDQDAEGEDDDADGENDEGVNDSMRVDEDGVDPDDDDREAASDQDFAEEEDEEQEVEEDDDADDTGIAGLGEDADDDEDEEEVQDSDAEDINATAPSDAEDVSDPGEDEGEDDAGSDAVDDDAEEVAAEEEPSRPSSAHSAVARPHKRSASVISDTSRTGSNRSAFGRKKRR